MAQSSVRNADLVIVGAGLAGLAAAAFAAMRGLRVAVVAWSRGEMPFASGLIDLLGVHPVEERACIEDPWAGLEALISRCPDHPYARLGVEDIRFALKSFLDFLDGAGLAYKSFPERNATLTTAAGTLKTSYGVPGTMWEGVAGLREKLPAVIVEFQGMKEFSAVQIVEALKGRWPELRAAQVPFPHPFPGPDRHTLPMAEALDSREGHAALAESLRSVAGDTRLVGLPAVLGIARSGELLSYLEEMTGASLFEIPTLPPSVPGHRLMNVLDEALRKAGVSLFLGKKVLKIETRGRRCERVHVGREGFEEIIEASAVVLAAGRFIGGGLSAWRTGVRESLLDLPVHQPQKREEWHRERFLDPRGHRINRAGLLIDPHFRPLDAKGDCAFENLFAAGTILAHQDWVREKCGAGLSVATAYGAVRACGQRIG